MASPKAKLDKRRLDITKVFLVYVSLVGDVEKTALALDLDPEIVQALATEEGWAAKVQRMCVVAHKEGKPGDYERQMNRAMAFVQAHQTGIAIDGIVGWFATKTPQEIMDALTVFDGRGKARLSARFFADLASAMEKVQHLRYYALGDTPPERLERTKEEKEGMDANALHHAVICALNAPGSRAVSADVLVKQIAEKAAQDVQKASERTEPSSPADSPPLVTPTNDPNA